MIREHHPIAAVAATAFGVFGASGGRVLGVVGCALTCGAVLVKDWYVNKRALRLLRQRNRSPR